MRLLWALIANLIRLLLLPLTWLRRTFAAPRGSWLLLELDGAVVEIAGRRPFWDRRPRPLSIQQLRQVLALAREDSHVVGLVVACESFDAGPATAESLRQVLVEFQASGKQLVCYLPRGGGARAWYLASAASRIFVGTDALVEPLGFSIQSPYLGQLLDRVEVDREVLARGRFKTAAEPLLERAMSEAQREQLGAYLDALSQSLVDALASSRGVTPSAAREWIDGGPWTAREALERGMCDAVLHVDEVPTTLDPSRSDGAVLVPVFGYGARRAVRFVPLRPSPHLAVLPLQGAIVSEAPGSFVPMAEEKELVEACRKLWADSRVRGVVLVVNSQGGSALASERIRRALERLGSRKPLVAYLSNVAASGGYLAAVAAPTIVAQPTTLTGSIGVIAARLSVGRILGRVGVAVQVEKRGEHADIYSPARTTSESERARLEHYVDDAYESFLAAVAAGRKLERDAVHAVAQGRIWSGRDAKERGLVDRLGGFDAALAALRDQLGPKSHAWEPKVVGRRRGPSPLAQILVRASGVQVPAGALGSVVRSGVGALAPLLFDSEARAYALCASVAAPYDAVDG
ncbi:MAG: signal peptide peptidase SppA [Polyangiaceae bacterium]|nr:signal peptide peptidase SppA [Polyangiaceae bacterium]